MAPAGGTLLADEVSESLIKVVGLAKRSMTIGAAESGDRHESSSWRRNEQHPVLIRVGS